MYAEHPPGAFVGYGDPFCEDEQSAKPVRRFAWMSAADTYPRSFNVFITPPAQFICKNQAILELCRKKTPSSDEDGVSFM